MYSRIEVPSKCVVVVAEGDCGSIQIDRCHIERQLATHIHTLRGIERPASDRDRKRDLHLAATTEGIVHILLFDLRVESKDVDREVFLDQHFPQTHDVFLRCDFLLKEVDALGECRVRLTDFAFQCQAFNQSLDIVIEQAGLEGQRPSDVSVFPDACLC